MGLRASFSVTSDLGYPDMVGLTFPDYSEGNEVFVNRFLEAAKDLVPVDTGALKRSIDADCDDDEITCVATEEYAQYVEYGTVNMQEQPYFEPALISALMAARPIWNAAVQDAETEEMERMEEEEEEAEREGANGNREKSGLGESIGRAAMYGIGKSFGFSFGGLLLGAVIGGIIAGIINIIGDMLGGAGSSSHTFFGTASFSEMSEIYSGSLENMNVEIT